MKRRKMKRVLLTALMVVLAAGTARAGTTGKLVGKVVDANTGQPLVGANVVLEGTYRGSATDLDGEYMIFNLPPGRYTVTASVIGYQNATFENVGVNIDRTTTLDFKLNPTVMQAAEAIVILAKKPVVKRDLTSTESMVSDEQLQMTPVDNLGDAVQLQAGVVKGHFRGGRSNEVAYMIDGVIVSDPYTKNDPLGRTTSNQVELAAIQEIQVISGTFNAEYGQAMSGIINVVTKEGDADKFHGELSVGLGDYVSGRSLDLGEYQPPPDRETYAEDLNPMDLQDYQASFSGPIPFSGGRTTFFTSGRILKDHGRVYGQRIFTPQDSSDFSSQNPANWYIEQSGDGEVVPLDPFQKWSMQAKLTHHFTPTLKLSYSILADHMKYRDLENRLDDPFEDARRFKYDPDGLYWKFRDGRNHILTVNQTLGRNTFYNLSASFTKSTMKYYVHEDPFDPDYVTQDRLADAQNFAFYTGGQGMWHHERETRKAGLKLDVTHQANKRHQLKGGFDIGQYLLRMKEFQLMWDDDLGRITINPLGAWNHQAYPDREASSPFGGFPFEGPGHRPTQIAAYLQDKMEYDFMVVNFGVRFDYFHPDGVVPEDLRDPANDRFAYYDAELDTVVQGLDPVSPVADPTSADPAQRYNRWHSKYREAKAVTQFSPRIGIAFPVTDRGVIHFSYGHFFQIPPFQYLYYNPEFTVRGGVKQSIIGNAELKPEQTVMYEVGLSQELMPGVAVNATGFYKDVRNLLGTEIQKTYAQEQYARYVNRDYGNVRGITVALDKRLENYYGIGIDYTFQVAEGNASDPNQVYIYNQSDPPQEPEKKVRPLDWDQTHTVNATITIGEPSQWSVGLIGRMGSGLPYTSTPFLGVPGELNDERRPTQYNVDLKAYRTFRWAGLRATATLWVYNLFDIRNENDVWKDTGRATYTLEQTRLASVRGYNTLDDYFSRPEWFNAPRQVKITLSFGF